MNNTLNLEDNENELVHLFRENTKTLLKHNLLFYLLKNVVKEFSVASEFTTPPYLEEVFNEASHNLEHLDETSLAEINRLKAELKTHISNYVVAATKQVVVGLVKDKDLLSKLTENAK